MLIPPNIHRILTLSASTQPSEIGLDDADWIAIGTDAPPVPLIELLPNNATRIVAPAPGDQPARTVYLHRDEIRPFIEALSKGMFTTPTTTRNAVAIRKDIAKRDPQWDPPAGALALTEPECRALRNFGKFFAAVGLRPQDADEETRRGHVLSQNTVDAFCEHFQPVARIIDRIAALQLG